jgi:hypothetical protein
MYTVEVSKRRFLSAMQYFFDKAVITLDSEHNNLWVSGVDTRIRVPLLKQVGKNKIKPFYLSRVCFEINDVTSDRLHLTFYKKEKCVIIEETFVKEWAMRPIPHSLEFIEREAIEGQKYLLPTLHFDLMSNLQCQDGTLTIDCEAVAGTDLIRRTFIKYDTLYPNFKLSQFAMNNLKNFNDTTITMQMCENKHILFKGAYFHLYAVNQV